MKQKEQAMTSKVLYTAMPAVWNDADCMYELVTYFEEGGASFRNSPQEILITDKDARVIKVTIEVLEDSLGTILEDKQHKG
jgi:hypothetical protein